MKAAVVCANGKAGQMITKEALRRGLDVTAVVRGENKLAAPQGHNQRRAGYHSQRFERL